MVACNAFSLFRGNRCGVVGETGTLNSCLVMNIADRDFSVRQNGLGIQSDLVGEVRGIQEAKLTSRVVVRRCRKRGIGSVVGCSVSILIMKSS